MGDDGQSTDLKTMTPRRKVSCTTCFDALWFCYSPVHQLQQYYRLGVLDNCSQKWSNLVECLTLKTKSSAEVQKILEERERGKSHIWSFRTPEEAAAQWQEWYGHLDEMDLAASHSFPKLLSRSHLPRYPLLSWRNCV